MEASKSKKSVAAAGLDPSPTNPSSQQVSLFPSIKKKIFSPINSSSQAGALRLYPAGDPIRLLPVRAWRRVQGPAGAEGIDQKVRGSLPRIVLQKSLLLELSLPLFTDLAPVDSAVESTWLVNQGMATATLGQREILPESSRHTSSTAGASPFLIW